MELLKSLSKPLLSRNSSQFKDMYNPQERWKRHINIVKDDKNLASVVIERVPHSKIYMKKPFILIGITKSMTVNELREEIRKILTLKSTETMILFIGTILPMASEKIKNLEQYIEPDGFMYFYISEHESFG